MRKQKLGYALTIALAAPALFAGCAIESKCGFRGCPGDAQITTKVQSLFDEHPDIGTEVNVQTLNHIVYLSGFVAAGEMRTAAEDIAGTAPGVSKVVDTIAVTH
jgi:osmotically-inducible protein OsmY